MQSRPTQTFNSHKALGDLRTVVAEGDIAPAVDGQARFNAVFGSQINGEGNIAFYGVLEGDNITPDNDRGIWRDTDGEIDLVIRAGQDAPGTDVEFSAFGSTLIQNGLGQIALSGGLRGEGIDNSNGEGIWAEDAEGKLKLIAREGDLMNIGAGSGEDDFRVVTGLDFNGVSGNEDGYSSPFNDLGSLFSRLHSSHCPASHHLDCFFQMPLPPKSVSEPCSLGILLSAAAPGLSLRRRCS